MKIVNICISVTFAIIFISCESKQQQETRLKNQERHRIEMAEKLERDEKIRVEQENIKRRALEVQVEEKRKEKEMYDRYINNSLRNGSTPYSYCYGPNGRCSENGCSEIMVRTPENSDVLVTIKAGGNVVRHAFISAGYSYTFELRNGTYQVFFYYGKGWNPDKFMKNTSCGELKGGFIEDESFGKDEPQHLDNSILEYQLILQKNGNFSTSPSNQQDAL